MSRVCALCILVMIPFAALAEAQPPPVQPPKNPFEGFWSAELKMGAMTPDIDKSPGLGKNTPYKNSMGGGSMLFSQVEVDRFLWSEVGSAGIGLSAGYGEKYGQALYDNLTVAPLRTGIHFAPIKALAVYRMDYLVQQYDIPFVAFAKLGLIYEPWWASSGQGVDYAGTQRGAGARWGYGWTIGGSFLLDFLEERLGKDASIDLGIVHTYAFVEYDSDIVDSFGKAGIDLSNRRLMFGLAFDF